MDLVNQLDQFECLDLKLDEKFYHPFKICFNSATFYKGSRFRRCDGHKHKNLVSSSIKLSINFDVSKSIFYKKMTLQTNQLIPRFSLETITN